MTDITRIVKDKLDASQLVTHNSDPAAHPELSAFITSEADRAENAASVAALNANIYADTAAGLAATSVGDYFSTPAPEDENYLILYLHDTGSIATQIDTYPNSRKVDLLESRIDSSLEETESDDFLFRITDAAGNIVGRMDRSGGLELAGLESSVQTELESIRDDIQTSSTSPSDDVVITIDAKGNIVRKINNAGYEITSSTNPVFTSNAQYIVNPDSKEGFTTESLTLLSQLSLVKSVLPPCPWLLLPNKYEVPNSIVDAFTVTQPANYTPLDTPYYQDDDVVHPYVCEVPTNFLGYKYLMAQTPYYNTLQENPTLYGSNDGDNWTMIDECPKPLAVSPLDAVGLHLSDNSIAYDPINGLLYVIWRETRSDGDNIWKARHTENGIVWSDTLDIAPPNPNNDNLSPSFLFNPNDGLWHVWYSETQNDMTHATATQLTGTYTIVQNTANFNSMWHTEVKFMGNKYLMLLNSRNADNIRFCISDDGSSWTTGSPLISFTGIYKCSYLPIFNGDNLTFKIYFAVNNSGNPAFEKRMLINTTNTVDISTLAQD